MAKFQGLLGIVRTEETAPGVHKEVATEFIISGDVLKDSRRLEKGDRVNDNLVLSNRFSFIYNDDTLLNLEYIRYIKWMNVSWKVTYVEVVPPRIIITAGEVYNGITC